MRTIDISGLNLIGRGAFGNVYQLSNELVIKIYRTVSYRSNKVIGRIMAEEVRLSRSSPHILPVLEVVIAKKVDRYTQYYYAVIKKYLPYSASREKIEELRKVIPDIFRSECGGSNVLVDKDGTAYLIDAQGPYELSHI